MTAGMFGNGSVEVSFWALRLSFWAKRRISSFGAWKTPREI